jgi:L-cysteine S-thiosulfotransferase
MISTRSISAVFACSLFLLGCTTPASVARPDLTAELNQMLKTSFRDQGIATVNRLEQDVGNKTCSLADGSASGELTAAQVKLIEAENLKTIQWPSDAKYLGDWKLGEAVAQSGRGATWSDSATTINGGNCYNCHQITKQEISHGTLGPSLYQYGKLRGVSDPNSDSAKAIVQYTWGKIYNAKAYNACSGMPRLGHAGVLSQEQLKHLMALLLDPASPVNQ